MGFPSPAEDYIDQDLNLNSYLIQHPAATFFLRMSGDAMNQAGIYDNDILIVDKSLSPLNNSIIIAIYNDEFITRKLYQSNKVTQLVAANSAYPTYTIHNDDELIIWGVVTSVIRTLL